MNENEIIKEARKRLYNFQIIPEATQKEKEYNKHIFEIQGRPEEYPAFYNRVLVKRYSFCLSSWDYETPTNIYTLYDLSTLIILLKGIEKAENDCNFERADDISAFLENFLFNITPPEVYTAQ